MHIHYAKNNKQIGPIIISDLKPNEISKETLVWFEGQADWIPAGEVEELKSYFSKVPPPLPKVERINQDGESQKAYEKRTDAIGFGILLIVLPIGVYFFKHLIEDSKFIYATYGFLLLLRIAAIVTVYKIAKEQNRGTDGWLIFALFLPSISLISIGNLGKKSQKSNYLDELEKIDDSN
ncbi:MAG: hypothetical protein RLZ33_2598 [Bacteroidota bacterium]|jgi:hypothetical protein